MTDDVRDFSKRRSRHLFRVDDTGDLLEAAPALPAEALAEFAGRFSNLEDTDASKRFNVLVDVLEMVLLPESFALLRKKMSDKKNPVELDQLNDIIVWLLGEYGLRPTQPLPDSSTGQSDPESGTNSTDSVLLAGSTFGPSPAISFST